MTMEEERSGVSLPTTETNLECMKECMKRSFELIADGRLHEAAGELQTQIAQHPNYPLLSHRPPAKPVA